MPQSVSTAINFVRIFMAPELISEGNIVIEGSLLARIHGVFAHFRSDNDETWELFRHQLSSDYGFAGTINIYEGFYEHPTRIIFLRGRSI